MKIQFGHEATTSFSLWFEHHLLDHGEAYKNLTGKLYYIEDERLPVGEFRYSSPYKQWVTESGVGNGAYVPTYISGSNNEIKRDDAVLGHFIDFDNGGVVVTGPGASDALDLSGYFGVKEFNIYNTNETEESLIIENKFETNSRFTTTEFGIRPYDYVTPAVFINNEYMTNEGFAFGGEDKTTLSFKSVVMAENLYQLDGVLSLFGDSRNIAYPSVNFGDHPINEYGDLKNEPYQYTGLMEANKRDVFNIERVVISKISETARAAISPTLFIGFIDFEVTKIRFPRVC